MSEREKAKLLRIFLEETDKLRGIESYGHTERGEEQRG